MATKRSLEDEPTVGTLGEGEGAKRMKGEDSVASTEAAAGGEVIVEPELMEIRVLIDNYEAAVIIGKGGSNVKIVRSESGAFVSILKNDNPTTKERVMTVKGTETSIAKAMQCILQLVLDANNQRKLTDPKGAGEPETTYQMKILIHKFLAGSIIGKGGAIIREIQEATQCRISLSTEPLAGSTEKTVTLTGTVETFHAGITRVLSQLANNTLRQGSSSILYVPGVLIPPAYGGPPGYSPYGAPSPYGVPPPQHLAGYGAGSQSPYPGQGGGASASSPYGIPPAHQSPYGAPAAASPYGAPYGSPAAAAGGAAGAGGAPRVEKIVIPSICAGTVIGKGGSIIRDIKMQSGLVGISIADPEPTAPADRVVKLTGTSQGIQAAIFMIRQRVESYTPPPGGAPQ